MKNQKSRLRQQAELPTPGFLLVRERLHILLWLLCPYFSKTTNTTISACWFYESKLFRTTWRNCETITWSSWSQRQTTVSGSRKRGGSPVTLIDASFKVGTLQRDGAAGALDSLQSLGSTLSLFSRRMAFLTFPVGARIKALKLKVRLPHLPLLLYVSSHVPPVLNSSIPIILSSLLLLGL